MPYFPDDWIMPGEFSFCGTCGHDDTLRRCPWQLRPPCDRCLFNERQTEELRESIVVWRRISQEAFTVRENLANIRKNNGLPPLFWMSHPCTEVIHVENNHGIPLATFEVKFQDFVDQLKEAIASIGVCHHKSALGMAAYRIQTYLERHKIDG